MRILTILIICGFATTFHAEAEQHYEPHEMCLGAAVAIHDLVRNQVLDSNIEHTRRLIKNAKEKGLKDGQIDKVQELAYIPGYMRISNYLEMPVEQEGDMFKVYVWHEVNGKREYNCYVIKYNKGVLFNYKSWVLHDVEPGVKHKQFALQEKAKELMRLRAEETMLNNLGARLKEQSAEFIDKTIATLRESFPMGESFRVSRNGEMYYGFYYIEREGRMDTIPMSVKYLGGDPDDSNNWRFITDKDK